MDNKRADISQIQDYLASRLDGKAMHRLEREAQDDPFLMDAMEGYEQVGDQQGSLSELQQRLQQRVAPAKTRRIIPWTTIAIAAGVVGFLLVVGLLYNRQAGIAPQNDVAVTSPNKADTALAEPPPPVIADASRVAPVAKPVPTQLSKANTITGKTNRPIIAYQPAAPVTRTDSKVAEPVANEAPKADTMPLEDMVMGAIARQKDTLDAPQTVAIVKRPMSQPVTSKVQGVNTTEAPGKRADANTYNLGDLAPKPPPRDLLKGQVISRSDGKPLPGVTVNAGGQAAAVTDANGNFSLKTDNNSEVNFGYLGFNSKKVVAHPGDSIKVELQENTSSLAEVAIISPFNVLSNTAPGVVEPKDGWAAYHAYVTNNRMLPKGSKGGTVEVQFAVDPRGALSNIHVTKSVDPAADKAAISLIKNGPAWKGSGKTETVTVSVLMIVKR